MSLPWFRFYAEFAGDPILQSLAFEDQRHFVMALCLKCNGTLDRKLLSEKRELIIARGLGLDPVAAVEAKRRLMEVGLIDDHWQPQGWNKRQFVSDVSTERTRKYRNLNNTGNVPGTFRERPRYRTDTDTEVNKGKKEKPVDKPGFMNGLKQLKEHIDKVKP